MSNETRRPPISRAEARRRARQLERGDGVDDAEDVEPSAEAGARPSGPAGLFGRLFPPAPPLPGKPDPLASFTYSGPLRGVVAGLYVLAFNPRGWLLPGIGWAVAQMLSYVNLLTAAAYAGQFPDTAPPNYGLIEIVGLLGTVFAVVAAGWIGWQRPWLFGLAASIAGTLIQATILALLIDPVPLPERELRQHLHRDHRQPDPAAAVGAGRPDRLVRRLPATPHDGHRAGCADRGAGAAADRPNPARNLLDVSGEGVGEPMGCPAPTGSGPSPMEARAGGDNHGPSRRTARLFA